MQDAVSGLLHHVKYNRWASQRTLESVQPLSNEELDRPLGASYGSVRGTLGHIYQADQVWYARLMGEPVKSLADFQPNDDRSQFEKDWLALLDRYVSWCEGLAGEDWERVVDYRDTEGNPHQTPIWQILLHLTNHDSYHRGQVAAMLRQLGRVPQGTDLIRYYRSLR